MADGKVVFEIEADDSKVSAQVDQAGKKVEKAAKSAEQEVKSSADGAAKEVKQAASKAESSLDGVSSAADKVDSSMDGIGPGGLAQLRQQADEAAQEIEDLKAQVADLQEQLDKKGGSSGGGGFFGGILDGANGVIQNVLGMKGVTLTSATAIGGAFVAAGGFAVSAANDMQGAMNQFQAATGVADDELEAYQETLESIYANNYGESFEDIADKMGSVKQQLGDISQTDLQKITEGVYTLEDTFGSDFNESLRGVDQLMTQFGLSAEEALDLMAAGSQEGLDYTDELGDNISEYAGKFAQAGYSAEDYFQLLANGSDGGAYNLDKVNDAINEVTTRLADGTIEGALSSFNQETQDVFRAWQNGEATQKDVIDAIVKNIGECTSEQEALTLASTAFGTMGEDANLQFIESLTSVGDTFEDTTGKMQEMQDIKYDDLGAMLDELKRSVELLVVPLGEAFIPLLSTLLEALQPVMTALGDTLTPIFEQLGDLMTQLAEPLGGIVQFFADIAGQALTLAMESLTPLFDVFMQLLDPIMQLVNGLLGPLTELFQNLFDPLSTLMSEAMEPILGLFNDLLEPITSLITGLLPPLQSLFDGLTPILTKLFDALSPVFDILGYIADRIGSNLGPMISFLAELLSSTLGAAVDNVMNILDVFLDILGGVIDFVAGVFTGNWEQAWNGIVSVFKGIINIIPSAIQSVLNSAIGVINGLIGGVNKVAGVVGIQIPTIPKVSIPKFHTGGVVDFDTGEGLALLKDGEMVLTQAQQAELFAMLDSPGSIDTGGGSYTIELKGDVTMDGFQVGKVVLRNLDDVAAFTLKGV